MIETQRKLLGIVPVVALAGLVAVVAAGAAPAPPARPAAMAAVPGARTFEFPSLNRTYQMDDSEMAPVQQGPITIRLSSPSNALVIRKHSVALQPLGDGSYRASVGLDFLGKGDLVADFETANGSSSEMKDLVVVPPQKLHIDGRVRFARVADGWDVTALALPEQVEIDIRSRLANSLVTLCSQMAVFLGLDCSGLDQSLSRVAVPLPPPGSVFHLPAADLTSAEAARLDAYLGFGQAAASAPARPGIP